MVEDECTGVCVGVGVYVNFVWLCDCSHHNYMVKS